MASETADGTSAVPGVHHMNPKTLLNQFLMRYCVKPVAKGDMQFITVAEPSGVGFMSTLQLPTVGAKEGIAKVPEFVGEICESEKAAEQSAARMALDHYADWLAANPAPAKDPSKKKPTKRKAGELGAETTSAPLAQAARRETYELNFVEGSARESAAANKSLNNQPAWMTRGLGVNKEIFGESKGNLVKPGMYEDDLARIEATVSSRLSNEADPFGDIFAERNGGSDEPPVAANPWRRAPLPPQEETVAGAIGTSNGWEPEGPRPVAVPKNSRVLVLPSRAPAIGSKVAPSKVAPSKVAPTKAKAATPAGPGFSPWDLL